MAVHAKQIAKRASFRAMQQQTNVERRHIDEALSALHKENTQHMDEVRGGYCITWSCTYPNPKHIVASPAPAMTSHCCELGLTKHASRRRSWSTPCLHIMPTRCSCHVPQSHARHPLRT